MWCECIYDIIQYDEVHDLSCKIMYARFTDHKLPLLIEKFKVENVIFRCVGTRNQKKDEIFSELDLIYVVYHGTTSLLLKLLI
jgi:hypothetical protein